MDALSSAIQRSRLRICLAVAFTALLAIAVLVEPVFLSCQAFADEDEAASDSSAVAENPVGQDAPDYANASDDDDDPENRIDPTQRADNSFIYDTTIESLFEQASLYEGNTVQVVGEVVGDLIKAGDQGDIGRDLYWIMLTSTDVENKSSISVLISAEQAQQIDHYGKYGVTGTTLQVRGIYHQACDDHQGLPDIHATDTSPMARGVEHPDAFEVGDFFPGIVAVLIGAILLGAYYFARERSR